MLNDLSRTLPYGLVANIDGGCGPQNPGGIATAGWVLYADRQDQPIAEEYFVVADGGSLTTNNVAEYRALISLLEFLMDKGWRGEIVIQSDSNLLVNQITKRWQIKAAHLRALAERAWGLANHLEIPYTSLVWIPREQNQYADDLCERAYNEYLTVSGKKRALS